LVLAGTLARAETLVLALYLAPALFSSHDPPAAVKERDQGRHDASRSVLPSQISDSGALA
jgi:hypothetical protein